MKTAKNDHFKNWLIIIIPTIGLSCNDNTVRNDSVKENTSRRLYDAGESYFMNYCISCHHVIKKDGFVWPSVAELAKIDSLKRNALLDKALKDSIHADVVKNITREQFSEIRYFINAK